MTRRVRGTGTVLGALAVAGGALGAVALGAASRGALVLHQCVAGDPSLLQAGVRLALLRPDPDCASGMALGAAPGAATPIVVTVAVPALLAQILALAVALGLTARGRDLLRRLAAAFRPRPAEPTPVRTPVAVLPLGGATVGRASRTPRIERRRGPPVGLAPAL